jgi:hypothetical protein
MKPPELDSMYYCATHVAGCNFRPAESVQQGVRERPSGGAT